MPTIVHPTIPDVTREVPQRDLAAWLAQGWLTATPKPRTVKRSLKPRKPRTKTPRSATTRQQ